MLRPAQRGGAVFKKLIYLQKKSLFTFKSRPIYPPISVRSTLPNLREKKPEVKQNSPKKIRSALRLPSDLPSDWRPICSTKSTHESPGICVTNQHGPPRLKASARAGSQTHGPGACRGHIVETRARFARSFVLGGPRCVPELAPLARSLVEVHEIFLIF